MEIWEISERTLLYDSEYCQIILYIPLRKSLQNLCNPRIDIYAQLNVFMSQMI